MAQKKDIDQNLLDLKEYLTENKLIFGTEVVLKQLRKGQLNKIYLSRNCPKKVREEIDHYAKMVSIPVIRLDVDNEEISVWCKKSFFISVLGVKNQ